MLNKMFMFHYQLNQNTGCKVKSVVNIKGSRRDYRIVIEVSSHFTCPEFTPGLPCRWRRVNFRWVTPSLPRG